MPVDDSSPPGVAAGRDFRTTHWSLVLAAGAPSETSSDLALEQLCRTYWYPVFAYVRRRGFRPEDAQDLTQGFFARLLEKDWLKEADSSKGRFRTFLLTLLTRFLANEHERTQAQKRGGRIDFVALDAATAEARYALEPREESTPETEFSRRWADALMGRVLDRLRAEFDGAGRAGRFDELKVFLLAPKGETSYAEVARRLGMSESAVTSGIFRLRQRYAVLLREEIGSTVRDESEVEEEIRHLLGVLIT